MTQNNRLFLWTLVTTIVVALAWIFWTLPAKAEWPGDTFTYKGYRKDLYWGKYHCGGRYRREGCERWRQRRWKARHVPVASGDALCQPVVPRTGEQAQSETAAYESAVTAWRGEVRFLYGERYTDLDKARNKDRTCAPSSVADSVRDKTLAPLFRCRITARPCRVEARPVKDDD
jgi:hypothetical protein